MSRSVSVEDRIPDPVVAARYAGRELGTDEILEILPHRPPFLFVDRVIEVDPVVSAVGIKTVTITEPFFAGHFPGRPVMPGVLILEALAQVSGVMLLTGVERAGRLAYFTSIKEAKFRRPVRPGDVLRLETTMRRFSVRFGRLVCWMDTKALVDGETVAEARCSFALVGDE